MPSGICRFCGCTSLQACAGGCKWIDQQATICSQCVGQLSKEELELLFVAEMEMAITGDAALPPIVVGPAEGFILLSLLQLALTHPRFSDCAPEGDTVADFASRFSLKLAEALDAVGPAIGEAARRGFDRALNEPFAAAEKLPSPLLPSSGT